MIVRCEMGIWNSLSRIMSMYRPSKQDWFCQSGIEAARAGLVPPERCRFSGMDPNVEVQAQHKFKIKPQKRFILHFLTLSLLQLLVTYFNTRVSEYEDEENVFRSLLCHHVILHLMNQNS